MAAQRNFFQLTPERVLAAVEQQGVRGSGYVFALNSFENRVYDVELDGENGPERKIIKFYRPGRWSRAALQAEHDFLRALDEAGVGTAPYEPIRADSAETIGELPTDDGVIYFAIAARIRGRVPTEVIDDDLPRVAAALAELHAVGASIDCTERGALDGETYGRRALAAVLARNAIPDELVTPYTERAEAIIAHAARTVDQSRRHAIHADCHIGNLLWRNEVPLFVDLDDFVSGPPVQDLWLLAGGSDEYGQRRFEILCDAYQRQRNLPPESQQLVPELRALRVLRYAGWVASRYDDPAFLAAFPDFCDRRHWQSELRVLDQILAEIG